MTTESAVHVPGMEVTAKFAENTVGKCELWDYGLSKVRML